MSEALLMWLLAGLGGLILGLAKLWWDHIKECRQRIAEMAAMKTEIQNIKHEVGDHSTGIRGSIHELRDAVSPFCVWAQMEMERRK